MAVAGRIVFGIGSNRLLPMIVVRIGAVLFGAGPRWLGAAVQRQAAPNRAGTQIAAAENTRAAARATDDWVHAHPCGAMGVAAGLGFLVGLLAARG